MLSTWKEEPKVKRRPLHPSLESICFLVSSIVETRDLDSLVGWFVITARPMDPAKDLGSYGYGSIAWKERVESWKLRQGMQMTTTEEGQLQARGKGAHDDNGLNGPDLPM
jgi:hypothetical protein